MLSGIPNCSAAQTREPSEQRQAISPAPTSQRVGTETSRSCSRQVRKSPERLGSVEERNSHILHRQVKHFSIFSDKCGDFPPLGDLSRASPDAFHLQKGIGGGGKRSGRRTREGLAEFERTGGANVQRSPFRRGGRRSTIRGWSRNGNPASTTAHRDRGVRRFERKVLHNAKLNTYI